MNVLAVVAHPDDEVLGCGATLAKHVDRDDDVQVLILGRESLRAEAFSAGDVLGTNQTRVGSLPDQAFDTIPFDKIVALLDGESPDLIYTHNLSDLNLDHRITAQAVLTAFRACVSRATILTFETISSTEWGPEPFAPNHFVEVTHPQLKRKCEALLCYPGEWREPPHPRNAVGIYNCAEHRGFQAGVKYAEAFRVIRQHA